MQQTRFPIHYYHWVTVLLLPLAPLGALLTMPPACAAAVNLTVWLTDANSAWGRVGGLYG